jgi:arylsulfatase A-like enzyme
MTRQLAGGQSAGMRPNILLVHCHDLGQYLGCYGVATVRTPNLDAFAGEGVRFERSFCTAPSCSPSRASIFTGRYPHSNGVMGLCHAYFAWDLRPDERHLAQILADTGYATAAVGVIHETRSGAERCGYQSYDAPVRARDATDAAIARLRAFASLLDCGSSASAAPAELAHSRFFLSVGFIEPHRLPLENSDPPGEHGFTTPYIAADDSLGIQIPGYLRDTPGTRQELAELQGAVAHVDEQFGRLIAALRELGLEQDTLVVFTTDHGVAMPRAKCSLYDPGISVAFMLQLPSRPGWHGGITHRAFVSNIDYVPTFLDLLGLPVPENVQGRSLAPFLDGREYAPRSEIFAEMTYHDYYDPRRCIRTESHKLIVNFSTASAFMDPSQSWRPRSDTVSPANHAIAYHNHVELYDLQADPWELDDVADDLAYREVKRELLTRLRRHLVATDDPILTGAVAGPHHRAAVAELAISS